MDTSKMNYGIRHASEKNAGISVYAVERTKTVRSEIYLPHGVLLRWRTG